METTHFRASEQYKRNTRNIQLEIFIRHVRGMKQSNTQKEVVKNYSHTVDTYARISRTFITWDVCAIVKHFTRPLWDHDPWRRNTADVKCFENDIQHKTFSVAWTVVPTMSPGGVQPTLKGVVFCKCRIFPFCTLIHATCVGPTPLPLS